MQRGIAWLSVVMLAGFIAGCAKPANPGAGEPGAAVASEKRDPVTISFSNGFLTDEDFDRYITQPVQKKYPWITIQKSNGKGLTERVGAGDTPDIVVHHNIGGMQTYLDLNLTYPLTEMIKKHRMDLNRFEPEALDAVKAATQMDELVGLPYTRHFSALYYNKDIFDKFAVPYPKDGITWDEAYELAKKLTRMEGGVQYRGLEPNVTERPASQLSLPYVDPTTKKALVNTESWKKVLGFMAKIRQIPGNDQITYHGGANDVFVKEQRLAMLASNNILFEGNLYKYPDFNWDMVTYPTWPEAPGIALRNDQHMMSIAGTSKHKDEAFLVIATVTSDEVQMSISRQGKLSILKDQSIRDAFGADLDFAKGKNLQAIYKTKPAKSFVPTKYDSIGMGAINDALKDVVSGGKDLNTVLREAEEKINLKIAEKEGGSAK
ncbi:ABC transporter substrate-binding protein [Paenibacillus sp. GYB003]|uniref:ABC transporter substrate-binding protein n=1 Tax=Paenibacillus sp. GYB003 TaxID=2994392 RepID=UPI002F96187A